ncbi:carboxypeptidase-like regulatory domain-containing protein [Terriglobus roseus]|uniref:Carboxypeptidase regulatory-like domain-containing protein n=1 Tax=Terriglobus roseus TaxID=392734 RepID=A0A1H4KI43_9BACT|nr:carboxypeptidase-like regulatory domain-containing protein [Terriglobus roseus]SEB58083.1 Carboxypeptidase regulatory-like domain-containing protein [Terriglobus roseus]
MLDLRRFALSVALISALTSGCLYAQTLPDAPSSVKTRASLQGHVIDTNGAPVAGAYVTLVNAKGANDRVIHAGDDGTFLFSDLTPATVRLTVTASGMETFVSPEIHLDPGGAETVPEIILPIAPFNTDVSVVATQEQVAQAQLDAALHQRALGVLPNFYSSYIWDAAPLNFRQKTRLAFRSTTDPAEFVVVGFVAGVEQARNSFKDYGQGAQGYGKRFGAAYADVVVSRFFGSAVFPSIFRQDPRYFYLGSGSVAKRAGYAMSTAVIQKGNSGHFQPAYSRILGSVVAGAISNLYRPDANRGAGLIFRNVGIGIGGHAVVSLVREFVLRKVTSGIPDYEQGKPVAESTAPKAAPAP